jgi:putative ABC transport system ATP-binding protein
MLVAHDLSLQLESRTLFEGVSFELPEGDVLWVRGPSGSGKSQLLRLIAGLVGGGGRVSWRGDDRDRTDPTRWRRRVSYVAPELPRGVAATGVELRARVEGLHAQRGVDGDPVGLAEGWGLGADAWERPLSQLSSGEAQRLWLALVLSRRPEVLLLDEPTRALDPDATAAVESSLAGHTALWVSHDPAQGARVAAGEVSLG